MITNCLSFFIRSIKKKGVLLKMIRKILKEIQKLEKEKSLKLDAKSKLENEIAEHTTRLKQLYSLKNEYEKIENGINQYFNPPNENTKN